MRLDRFICKSTELTKAEAVQRIEDACVTVNGVCICLPSHQINENNVIQLDGQTLVARPFRYLMMHKPAGYICSNIDEAYPSLFNLLDIERANELHIVGRLDADTTGLVIITDDGRWSFNITRPTQNCPKTYRVRLAKPLTQEAAHQIEAGIFLQGENDPTRPAKLKFLSNQEVLLTITEGKFHQVKRMFSAISNKVKQLHREKVGNISLNLDSGEWRLLTKEEIQYFVTEPEKSECDAD